MATDVGVAHADLDPALRTVAGTWPIAFTVTDRTGRTRQRAFDGRHEPLAPALAIARVTGPSTLASALRHQWIGSAGLEAGRNRVMQAIGVAVGRGRCRGSL